MNPIESTNKVFGPENVWGYVVVKKCLMRDRLIINAMNVYVYQGRDGCLSSSSLLLLLLIIIISMLFYCIYRLLNLE